MNVFVHTADQIERLVDSAYQSGLIGLDTEFYNVKVGKQSTVARSELHLLSIATPTSTLTPRGYHSSHAAVLLRDSLSVPALREMLTSSKVKKAVHNLPVDAHTLQNAGVALGGGENTLALARYAWPERARNEGFGLDSLGQDFCMVGKLESFDAIFSEEVEDFIIRTKRISYCECGATPCRKRTSSPGHRRLERCEETRTPKMIIQEVPLETVVPGHKLWDRAVAYSAQDAILALAIYELATEVLNRKEVEIPWVSNLGQLSLPGVA